MHSQTRVKLFLTTVLLMVTCAVVYQARVPGGLVLGPAVQEAAVFWAVVHVPSPPAPGPPPERAPVPPGRLVKPAPSVRVSLSFEAVACGAALA